MAITVLRKLMAATEQWKRRHNKAMRDIEAFPQVLKTIVSAFHVINEIDNAWNAEVSRQTIPHDEEDVTEIAGYYSDWLRSAEAIERDLAEYQKAGVPFADARAFLECLEECRGLFTPDEEFFDGDRLAALRDRALRAHQRGESSEMAELGD